MVNNIILVNFNTTIWKKGKHIDRKSAYFDKVKYPWLKMRLKISMYKNNNFVIKQRPLQLLQVLCSKSTTYFCICYCEILLVLFCTVVKHSHRPTTYCIWHVGHCILICVLIEMWLFYISRKRKLDFLFQIRIQVHKTVVIQVCK